MQKLLAGTLSLVLVAGMTGTAFAQTTPGLAVDVVAETPPVKVDVCHDGGTINIAPAAVPTHVPGHPGDYLGACLPDSDFDGDLVLSADDPDDNDPCNPNPNAEACLAQGDDNPVAGELLSVDSSALVIGGLASSAVWMIPAVAGIAGAGIYLVKFRANK